MGEWRDPGRIRNPVIKTSQNRAGIMQRPICTAIVLLHAVDTLAFAPPHITRIYPPMKLPNTYTQGLEGIHHSRVGKGGVDPRTGLCSLRASILPASIIPSVAGAIGGAIGVGAAFPFDTLKTKAQTYESGEGEERQAMGIVAIAQRVVETEGVSGFYGGVSTMMVGQAFIKALAFSCNDWALQWQGVTHQSTTLPQLCAAALFAGFVTSFLVNPFERIKILCQAEAVGTYTNGLACAQEIIKTDGFLGFMGRGLGPTLSRCSIYVIKEYVAVIYGDCCGDLWGFHLHGQGSWSDCVTVFYMCN